VSTADEQPVPAAVPLWEVPGWRQRFGVIAGITGRGEEPDQPFDLGLWTDQPVGGVMERWRRFRAALPACPRSVMAHQVHGDRVLWHGAVAEGWTILDGADGHATTTPGTLLLVTVADCVPIYLIAPTQRAIALVHAGWRGTAAGILARAVELLGERVSVHSSDIIMHAGVAISGARYEVGPEVFAAVENLPVQGGRSHLDLRQALLGQARRLGIGEVSSSSHCTASRRDRFFSHRGSGGRDGRMVAYLGFPQSQR
jgi:polyphenol oxidase